MVDQTTQGYLSVQVALIAAFEKLDLDFLCAARTAPCHSWRNPVERIMSTLNLGLQSVGLMRSQQSEDIEGDMKKCSSLKDLRAMARRKPDFGSAVSDSLSQPKVLLSQIFPRLKLKDENFIMATAAKEEMIEDMWLLLQEIEPTLSSCEPLRKHSIQSKPQLKAFLDHCCVKRKYVFQIKKCGSSTCTICKPPHLPSDIFEQIKFLPDPMPGEEGHYKSFSEVYGSSTSEKHCPSVATPARQKKTLPFASNLRHGR